MTKRHPESGEPIHEDIRDSGTPHFPDPTDPRTDPTETTQLPAVPEEDPEPAGTAPAPAPATPAPRTGRGRATTGSLAGSTWVAMVVGLLILILLIVFILQNQQQVELNLFAWSFQFPAGIGYLITAIAGGLIIALVGMVRMMELRRQVRKLRKQLR
ncbi:LapA family protein [Corynebacterium halotolerans]|uniref:LapA family protein n=1 Tax=Corynebacterium halotolerans TaxID=225326 RepID=UPI003CEB02E2